MQPSWEIYGVSSNYWLLYNFVFVLCRILHMLTSISLICRMFRDELERERVANIERTLRIQFQNWFRNHVSLTYIHAYFYFLDAMFQHLFWYVYYMWQILRLRNVGEGQIDDDLFSLACGPDFRVKKYSSCIVNGVRYNTLDRDKNKKT